MGEDGKEKNNKRKGIFACPRETVDTSLGFRVWVKKKGEENLNEWRKKRSKKEWRLIRTWRWSTAHRWTIIFPSFLSVLFLIDPLIFHLESLVLYAFILHGLSHLLFFLVALRPPFALTLHAQFTHAYAYCLHTVHIFFLSYLFSIFTFPLLDLILRRCGRKEKSNKTSLCRAFPSISPLFFFF